MKYTKVFVLFLILWPGPILSFTHRSKQNTLPDLRRYKVKGVGGRFVVSRDALECELQKRQQRDTTCGRDVYLRLPGSSLHAAYNVSNQGEVILFYQSITDHTLTAEMSNDLKELVAASFQYVTVAVPVTIGTTEKPGGLNLHVFTNSTKKVLPPYCTSVSEVTHVDNITEEDDGLVILQLGDDVMSFRVQNELNCSRDIDVGQDFDRLIGKVLPSTNYPLKFDWGCDVLGLQVSFCQALHKVERNLAVIGGDVCTLSSTSSSYRSPAAMMILNITGIFREVFPYLADTVPSKSFETELFEREHTAGITYPCLTL